MEDNANLPTTTVPVHVPKPDDNGPPTLAEPASGPVAEMSGALETSGLATEPPKEPVIASTEPHTVNGLSAPTTAPIAPEPAMPAEAAPVSETVSVGEADSKKKDESAPAPTTEAPAAAEPNGPEATLQRSTSNAKRKSTGGVPEHKSKKLNKKQSKAKITHLDAQPGEYYFARLKSYPPWPSIVCDEEMLPNSLLSTRPVTTRREDGVYRPDYADGGKKVSERTFPVMFLHTNEFAWIPNTDLNPLEPHSCKDVSEKGKAKALIAAYHVAAENHDLQYFKGILVEHAERLQEEADAAAARDAEKAAKAEKKKRKSEAATVEKDDVDMEDADDTTATKKSSKKRKKDVESDDEETEKPPKTPKTKLKLTTSKTPTTTEKKGRDSAKAPKAKSEKKSKKMEEDEDEEMVDASLKEPEKPVDPAEERKARGTEVLFLRHKLQKGFLTRDQAPQEDEMPQMSNYIKKLEGYEDLEVGIIRSTKINKVLKALMKLNTIPRDEEFKFRDRSMELLNKMNKVLGASEEGDHTEADKDADGEPVTNGVAKEEAPKPAEPAIDSASESKPVSAEPMEAEKAPTPSEPVAVAPIAAAVAPLMDGSSDSAPAPAPVAAPAVSEETKVLSMIPEPAKVEPEKLTPVPESTPAMTSGAADILKPLE